MLLGFPTRWPVLTSGMLLPGSSYQRRPSSLPPGTFLGLAYLVLRESVAHSVPGTSGVRRP